MNVTPLVDVVLVLLIIFMVVIPAMEQGTHIELPAIFNADPEEKSKTDPLLISVAEDGRVFLEHDAIQLSALVDKLKSETGTGPKRNVVVRIDRNAPYRLARNVFSECQKANVGTVALRVNERNDGRRTTE